MNHKLAVFFILILLNPVSTFAAGWELYDDFSSGTLDEAKWSNRSQVSDITAEIGRLKIVHLAGYPNQTGSLHLIQNLESILGIKAKIIIESCTGDVRTRLSGRLGDIGENHIWAGLQFEPGLERIFTNTGIQGPPPDYVWVQDTHYASFKRPLDLAGTSNVASMLFGTDQVIYEVEGLGSITYTTDTSLSTASIPWKSISTRSANGDGCTIYVDEVHVQRP